MGLEKQPIHSRIYKTMSSSSITLIPSNNPAATGDQSSRWRSSKKKKKLLHAPHKEQQPQALRWRTDSQQKIYSSKLIQALSKVNLKPSSPSASRRLRDVRKAADSALVMATKSRTLWSRAILTSRVKLKFRKAHSKRQQPQRATSMAGEVVSRSPARKPSVKRKAGVFGRWFPVVENSITI